MKRPCALLFALLLATAGCNAFSGLSEEGMSDDPQLLFQDAAVALQSGKPDKAVRYLRHALELEPDNVPARLKLGTALLAEADISALDFVQLARKISGELEKSRAALSTAGLRAARRTAARRTAASTAASCSFPEDLPRETFDPTDVGSYDAFQSGRSALMEVRRLDERVLGSTASFEEALRALQADVGATDMAAHLLNAAVARAALAYLDVAEAGGDAFDLYYVTPPRGNRYVGYCAPDPPTLDAVLGEVACHVAGLNRARRYVRVRADLLGSDLARELADGVDEAYAVFAENLEASCSPGRGM